MAVRTLPATAAVAEIDAAARARIAAVTEIEIEALGLGFRGNGGNATEAEHGRKHGGLGELEHGTSPVLA